MIDECLVVEFTVTGDDCPLAEATASTGVSVQSDPPLYRGDGTSLLRFSGTHGTDELAATLDEDERIDYLHVADTERGTNFRCLSDTPCILEELVRTGFLVESLEYWEGRGVFSGGVVGYEVLRSVLETTEDAVGVDLDRVYPLESGEDELLGEQWGVTPAQEEALRTAVEMEYVSVPREVTASDVAQRLGISKSAFLERLRRGEQHVLSRIFD
jgi:predicted DNA binding protein